MCGIAGICDFTCDFTRMNEEMHKKGKSMIKAIKHRGPDDDGVYVLDNIMFAHARLAVIDVENGKQPMSVTLNNYTYAICYN